jgi:hypothetical protein
MTITDEQKSSGDDGCRSSSSSSRESDDRATHRRRVKVVQHQVRGVAITVINLQQPRVSLTKAADSKPIVVRVAVAGARGAGRRRQR